MGNARTGAEPASGMPSPSASVAARYTFTVYFNTALTHVYIPGWHAPLMAG
jgi:hypothetical protein